MKDIEKIFRLAFAMDQEGFFKVPNAKPEPANLKGTPPNFDLQKVSSPTLETHSIASLEIKFSELGFLKSTTECSYFKGGETEALHRLERKVSCQPAYVNSFRKPKTSSTNLSSNSLEPSTTGLSPYIAIGSLARGLWKKWRKQTAKAAHFTT